MILESLVTTVDRAGRVNLAPMGPTVDPALTRFRLRPFATSRTCANLRETRRATIHVTDDCLLIARAALGAIEAMPPLMKNQKAGYCILQDCCRWFAVEIEQWNETAARIVAECRTVDQGEVRSFFGFNRAKHAVIEGAILATRIHILSPEAINTEMNRLRPLVEKTGGEQEHAAFLLLDEFFQRSLPGRVF
jgi:hypothetical protein